MLYKDWLTTPAFDLELKRYQLLAFLQRVQRGFEAQKIYPYLVELRSQLEDLVALQRSRERSQRLRQGDLLGMDLRRGHLLYSHADEPAFLDVVDELLERALPDLQQYTSVGEDLRRSLLTELRITPIGLQPMHQYEGWLLLREGTEARAYSYSIPWVVSTAQFDPAMQVRTRYIASFTWGSLSRLEQLRKRLEGEWPATYWVATYALESERTLPRMETLLPLARHLLFERIALITGPDGRTRPNAVEGSPSH
ncbi:MAG: hypothetical protein R2817_13910 [Flavobacteriales bacterium]